MKRVAYVLMPVTILACAFSGAFAQIFERTDPQREIELGRQVAAEVEQEMRLSRDPAMQERVQRIGQTLVKALPEKAYPYEFKVLEVQDFNAFCLPGGFMYVYEGLLTRLNDDDSVAFVMAHEMTHATHRHWRRMVEKMKGPAVLATIAGAVLGSAQIADLATLLVEAQYSREQEDDADRGGAELMWEAGYNPQGAVHASQEMEKLEKGTIIPVYLRSHPPAKDRTRVLTALAATLESRPLPESATKKGDTAIGETAIVGTLPSVQAVASRWLPLDVGNRWEYAVSRSADGYNTVTKYTIAVRAKVPTSHGDVWRVETGLPGRYSVVHQWMTDRAGVWRRSRPAVPASPWGREFAFDGGASSDGLVWTVVNDAQPVTTPCGVFSDVLHLHADSSGGAIDVWFAPNVGIVKRTSSGGTVVEVLTGYHLARGSEQRPPQQASAKR